MEYAGPRNTIAIVYYHYHEIKLAPARTIF